MKALIRTNRYLSKKSVRAELLARHATASAQIEGVRGAGKRIARLIRSHSCTRSSRKPA